MGAAAVDFELTPEEWEEVNLAHLMESSHFVDLVKNARIAGGLLFAALALLCLVMGFTLGAAIFALAGPPFVYAVRPLQEGGQRKALAKLSEEGIAHGVFGPHRVEVREEGLFHRSTAMETLIRWHAVDEVVDRPGHFFIYTGKNAFIPIPKTAFADAEQLRAFSDGFHRGLASAGPEPTTLPAPEQGRLDTP